MKPNTLINPNFPTVPGTSVMPGISSLVRVLAKVEKPPFGSLNTPSTVSPLRYGNRAQAEKKRESLADRLMREGSSSAVVQVESRFLVVSWPAEYDFDQKTGKLTEKARCDTGKDCGRPEAKTDWMAGSIAARGRGNHPVRRRPPFATVSGPRINPRNQHNHTHTLAANGLQPVYCGQKAPSESGTRARIAIRPISRLGQYRAVSERLNQEPKRRHW